MATTSQNTHMQKRTFEEPDEQRPAGRGHGDVVTIGDTSFARITLEPGWRWSTDVKPIANTHSCQAVHTGVVLSGRIHLIMDDGTEQEFAAGDVYHIPAGHDAWVLGEEKYEGVDVTGNFTWAQPSQGGLRNG